MTFWASMSHGVAANSYGTRAVQKGAKKALPLIATNSKAKKRVCHKSY